MAAEIDPESAGAPAPAPRRTIRTYADRTDADQACGNLIDSGIAAEVQEFYIKDPGGSGSMISRGCSLTVPVSDAGEAARQLMRMAPSAPAGKDRVPDGPPSRLRRGTGPPLKQKSSYWIVIVGIVGSAAAMFYLIHGFLDIRRNKQIRAVEEGVGNYVAEEDLNWDGQTDTEREYSVDGQLVQIREDRDFDGIFELRWTWQRGQLTYRDRDVNADGRMDERTFYDGFDQPFYVDLSSTGNGTVTNRRIYREGVLWKILDDADADTRFERIREYDVNGKLVRDEALPRDSAENNTPKKERLPAERTDGE